MQLGLDLGTGLTKLARHTPAGTRRLPGGEPVAPDVSLTATAVGYRGFASEIPAEPPGLEPRPDGSRCDGFPMMLSGDWLGARVPQWQNRAPAEVAQDFLRLVLDETSRAEADGPQAAPPGLAVAVPPVDTSQAGQDDRSTGAELPAMLTTLGYRLQRPVPAPVAALLYLRREHPGLAAATRIIVCDVGAGAISLTLCRVTGRGIRVAAATRLAGSRAWSDGTLPAAEAGDRPPALAEVLVTALARATGRTPPTGADAPAVSVHRWRGLEHALADAARRDRFEVVLREAARARQRHGRTVALRFADLEVTAAQMLDACAPLADRAGAALSTLLTVQDDPWWLRPGTCIVLTGGLSSLPPLRAGLLAGAGFDPEAPGDAVIEPDNTGRLGAAALGAALVAAGRADPGDRYPHGLRLLVHRTVRDQIVSSHLELAAAHSIDLELTETEFLSEDGERALVTIPATPLAREHRPLPVQIVPAGTGTPVPAVFTSPAAPPPGTYHVGVRGGPGGATVVLQHTDGGAPLYYTLAEAAGQAPDGLGAP